MGVRLWVVHHRHGSRGALAQRPRLRRRVPPPVPPLPLRWWGVSVVVPCNPLPDEESRREHVQAAARAFSVDMGSLGTAGSPLQSAQMPKDVNKGIARLPSQARSPGMVRSRPSRRGSPAKPLLCCRDTPCHPTGLYERLACSGDAREGHNRASVANHLFAAQAAVPHTPPRGCSQPSGWLPQHGKSRSRQYWPMKGSGPSSG